MNAIPEPWQTAMRAVNIHSYGELAAAADLSKSTVYTAVTGRRSKIQPATISGLAQALRLPEETISEYLGMGRQTIQEYTPPAEASMLTRRERDAVDELIRLLVASRAKPAVLGQTHLGDGAALKDQDSLNADDRDYIAQAEAKRAAYEKGDDWQLAAKMHDQEKS